MSILFICLVKMEKQLLSWICILLLIVNALAIKDKNSMMVRKGEDGDAADDEEDPAKQIGKPGMACLHGANGVCGHPAGCKAPGVPTPGHCIGDWTNQCCLMPIKKVYKARNIGKPTYDYEDTPDDITYCEHLDFCNHHGKCNVDLKECICDDMWYGDSCNRIVNYNTSVGAVTVTILDNFKATKRMDGNEMFLAKAHHRLRQIQALLRKPGLGNDKKLLNERERLIDRLGMRHLLLNSSSVHEKIKMDHGAWATTGATNDTLPVIVTSRLRDVAPTDDQIRKVVSKAMKKALIAAIKQNANGKAEKLDVPPNPILKPELTLLNKEKMVANGIKKQIKNKGDVQAGIVKGKILRDISREGHETEGHHDNPIDDLFSKDIRREHNDEVPGFEITYSKKRNETVGKSKEPETKMTEDYNAEIKKAFNKAQYDSKKKMPTPIEEALETEQQIADREEEERKERDLTMKIDDWNEYPNKRQPKVHNDYLDMKGPKHLSLPNVGDEFAAPHKEFKNVEPTGATGASGTTN